MANNKSFLWLLWFMKVSLSTPIQVLFQKGAAFLAAV
ncbi:uncharacterized protein PGTG_06699 [Puccinia graminis f. sp. tritici CRL 75-36-700-3]|uniref:Uncharacterized protein n=1 Tax=Puccinia graminis f. sp. tritici (strain CRL 75-36-700-3 / race SCCL) TaxID=418459 RepID=E3K8D3_PUCGT|nr:uncharacterized protein PGTG_06699 [Puccinia graminis f. sp. tritici CRL 75-36-700-3]EFP80743.1 hypothetical protein PGTG_06699 [Puccinia graminis f. sp. tritici CRL 75-36-700-3]